MELVGKLQFLNEYGELETVKPEDWVEALVGVVEGESGEGVVYIISFLAIFFMFTGENGLVLCFTPDDGIWASGTMLEAAVKVEEVGAGAAPEKKAAYGVASLLRETFQLVSSSRCPKFM